ncbi:putative carboxymuconolactone decarboxylase [Sphingopyxis fribergensis]|uniref:Putative carboxymuconolactone decarboxylase n=1 Tax=Sphingopyxis fribergensis TaxID=1515612 RepID=A0A0A7PDX2_9SPHN|nr:carboxymuconolactone decarboxylase family protein [Sphingopyxis fribergensis]AJA08180.1 putative carboxymuconolactone decarboxylase [Sphingopyxis fribergensis]
MTPRMNIFQAAPDTMKAMLAVEATFENSGIEHSLLELVKLRASQINGCAFCIHMHVTDAVKHGETHMRIHLLDAWRESPLFSDRERAALNWTESLTGIAETGAPDADYELLKAHFDDKQIGYLTAAVAAINFWNTVQISLRAVHPVEKPAAA